ncbi:prepilin-type N-terminal cleavage/methylation domain-containing protein [Thalassotalea litorea]|uniref:Type II secretion system protein H n=1 Tax=Thalassotalea litorea TaxID=2020715 RepID=A0A5R9ICY8_9GAMM|nr:GspH/FimT family pseudopilin [Thalassotalea litorea]TLU61451.1 prepilin-type N-terminal cleavage/methylation domain-containing protein [Thalassotalea litorea]
MKKIRGITFIELMITLAIMSILALVAAPSFVRSIENRHLTSAAEALYSQLQLARSESLLRSDDVVFSVSGMGSTSWAFGINQETACDPTVTDNTSASACVLQIDDGDGAFVAANDNVLHQFSASDFDNITMQASTVSGTAGNSITFDPARGTTDGARLYTLTNKSGVNVSVSLSLIGNVKLCSNDLSEYRSCS